MATGIDGHRPIRETVRAVLADYPVEVGILFGSHGRGEAREQSDIDIAVTFDGLEPGDSGYNDALLGLGADLSITLGTDDIDLVDLSQASPPLLRAVFEDGTVLVGSEQEVSALREELTESRPEQQSASDRFDEVLEAIDDSLP